MALHTLRQVVHLLGHLLLLVHLGCTLKQTRVEIEHITRIGLTTRRTTQNQRYLTIGNCLLRKVVVNYECRQTTIAEVLTDGSTSKWCIILHSCRIGSSSRYHDGIWHSTMLLKCRHKGCNGTGLLTDGNIDTIDRLACLIETLLVDDGINSNSGLTRLTVTNNELTLSTTNGDH